MTGRKFNINDQVRVIRGWLYFSRGRVVDYDLNRDSYEVLIPMIGTRWFGAADLEAAELARERINSFNGYS